MTRSQSNSYMKSDEAGKREVIREKEKADCSMDVQQESSHYRGENS